MKTVPSVGCSELKGLGGDAEHILSLILSFFVSLWFVLHFNWPILHLSTASVFKPEDHSEHLNSSTDLYSGNTAKPLIHNTALSPLCTLS